MGNLILPSLEIRNFRGFQHLQIGRLGRVNLIVGKNNIGKTSLLEALSLYANGGSPTTIWEILRIRDESTYRRGMRRSSAPVIKNLLSNLRYLFYNREDVTPSTEPIKIGPQSTPNDTLSISVGLYGTKVDEDGNGQLQLFEIEEQNTVDNPVPRFVIQLGAQKRLYSLSARKHCLFV